jgi:hypothetical protein
MADQDKDASVLARIQGLAAEEHALFARESLGDAARKRLAVVQAELDQCWDLLRQRRARRSAGLDPDEAVARSEAVVEHYQQ